jgi:hypothetical protein
MTESSKKKKKSTKKPSKNLKRKVKSLATAKTSAKSVDAFPEPIIYPVESENPVLPEPHRFIKEDTVWYQTLGMKFPMAAWIISVDKTAHTAVIETLDVMRNPVRYTVRIEYLRHRKLPER